jgi:hypothetical protein
VRAEAQIPHADEALRALFQRFKDAPGSSAFEELSEALLARGHAAEALQVTEHGLQIDPDSASGRVQRAAALLALGRTRVAYVELVRALAIERANARGLRLLGKVFVEAGAPERAAALLARRHEPTAQPPSSVDARALHEPSESRRSPPASTRGVPPESKAVKDSSIEDTDEDIPELFASLTKDLGLGPTIPPLLATKVEVTQVMRLRRPPRPGQTELSSIEGPIVDTTHPGEDNERRETSTLPPELLFDVVTAPQLAGLAPAPEDEPLFNDVMPFAVQPVHGREEETIDEADTAHDDERTPIDRKILETAIASEAKRLQGPPPIIQKKTSSNPPPPPPAELEDEPLVSSGDVEPASAPTDVSLLRARDRGRFKDTMPSRPQRERPATALKVVEPRPDRRTLAIGIVTAILLIGYLVGLGWLARAELSVWMQSDSPRVSTDERPGLAGPAPTKE